MHYNYESLQAALLSGKDKFKQSMVGLPMDWCVVAIKTDNH